MREKLTSALRALIRQLVSLYMFILYVIFILKVTFICKSNSFFFKFLYLFYKQLHFDQPIREPKIDLCYDNGILDLITEFV